jgi:hypothetical protein
LCVDCQQAYILPATWLSEFWRGPLCPTPTFAAWQSVVNAMDRFCSAHNPFKASITETNVRKATEKSQTLIEAALTPIRFRLFTFDAVLKWGVFISAGIRSGHFPKDMPPALRTFKIELYHEEVLKNYDVDVETDIWALWKDSEGETEDGDGDSDSE